MGGTLSNIFGVKDEPSDEYLQLTDLGSFLSKYIFIMLDKDKKKLVSKQEYLTLVNHFREQKTTEEELDIFLMKHVGEGNKVECIDEALFKKLIIHLAIDFDENIVERMKYLMTLFDKDEDGFVNEKDLCEVYDTIGIQVPMEPIRCLISRYDLDGDNKLSVEEFEQLGRSAMNKLFIKKDPNSTATTPPPSPETLVSEAIGRARVKIGTEEVPQHIPSEGESDLGDSSDLHEMNNNLVPDCPSNCHFIILDDVIFSRPVVVNDSKDLMLMRLDGSPPDSTSILGDPQLSQEGLMNMNEASNEESGTESNLDKGYDLDFGQNSSEGYSDVELNKNRVHLQKLTIPAAGEGDVTSDTLTEELTPIQSLNQLEIEDVE